MKRSRIGLQANGQFGFVVSKPGEDVDTSIYGRLVLTDTNKLQRCKTSGQFSPSVTISNSPFGGKQADVSFSIYFDKSYSYPPIVDYLVYLNLTGSDGNNYKISVGASARRYADHMDCAGTYLLNDFTYQSAAGYFYIMNDD